MAHPGVGARPGLARHWRRQVAAFRSLLLLPLLGTASCGAPEPNLEPLVLRIVASHVERMAEPEEIVVLDLITTDNLTLPFEVYQFLMTSGYVVIDASAYDPAYPALEFREVTRDLDEWQVETTISLPDSMGEAVITRMRWTVHCDSTACAVADSLVVPRDSIGTG